MLGKLLLLFLSILMFQSCQPNSTSMNVNKGIKKKIRKEIKVLNDQLIKSISDKNINGLKVLLSDDVLKKDGFEIEKTINELNATLQSNKYKILNEYQVKSSSTGNLNTIDSGDSDINDYLIMYQTLNEEMYVSVLMTEGKIIENLIIVVYGKYNDKWKINILKIGDYKINNKTAPEYYQLAKDCYEKDYLIDAVNYIGIAKYISRPADKFFQFKKEKNINEFYDKVMVEVQSKFKLPMTLENIETKPTLLRISPEITNDGVYPVVYYLSKIKLKNSKELKAENEQIKKEIGRIFTGIDKDKKYVVYKVFNEMPNDEGEVDNLVFIDELQD